MSDTLELSPPVTIYSKGGQLEFCLLQNLVR